MAGATLLCGLSLTYLTLMQPRAVTGIALAPHMAMQSPERFAATTGRESQEASDRATETQNRALSKGRLTTWQETLLEDPALFSGCKNVFLDVGSNRGTHIRKLFEPSKYPSAKYLEVFDRAFGTQRTGPFNETALCAFGFEANPRWVPRLLAIEKAYTASGWRVKFFAPSVVSNESGEATFFVTDDGKDSDWGASLFGSESTSKEVVVSKLDLPEMMTKIADQTEPGFKLMKMDIEGAEYTVLPPLLEQGLLCEDSLNTLTIEWHRKPGEATLGNLSNVWSFEKKVNDAERCRPKASTEVLSFDDESFREDGVPIPGFSDDADANPAGHNWQHKGNGSHAGAGSNCRGSLCEHHDLLQGPGPVAPAESCLGKSVLAKLMCMISR
jgi:FkbM family methyltransferase